MNVPSNEDQNWTLCSESDEAEAEVDLPEAETNESEQREWSICSEEADKERCTEAMDYVNGLIARMNAGDDSPLSKVTRSEEPAPTTPAPAPEKKTEPPLATEKSTERPPIEPSPIEPSPMDTSPAPSLSGQKTSERNRQAAVEEAESAEESQMRIANRPLVMAADMQRLREAVNLSMSGMLKSLDEKYLMRQAYAYLVVSAGFIATSMILLSMSPRISSASYVASAISTVIGGLAAWKFVKVARRLADVVRSDRQLA